MALPSFTLPEIKDSDLNSGKERRKILEYLYQLTEQLRYVLSNLDEENLAPALAEKLDGSQAVAALSGEIRDAYGNIAALRRTAQSLSSEITAVDGRVSTVEQTAGKINWVVKSGTSAANFQMTDRAISLVADSIDLGGFVTFSALAGNGTTTINGANIKTGTVAAARIDVDNLYVKHLSAADGSFAGSLSAPSGDIAGFKIGSNAIHAGSSGSSDYLRLYNGSGESGLQFWSGKLYAPGYTYIGDLGNAIECSCSFQANNIGVVSRLLMASPPSAAGTANVRLVERGSGYSLGIISSARRYKKRIQPIAPEGLAGQIDRVAAVTYEPRGGLEKGRSFYGFIAEEMEQEFPWLVDYTTIGGRIEAQSVQYDRITAILWADAQNTHAELRELRAAIAALGEKGEPVWTT